MKISTDALAVALARETSSGAVSTDPAMLDRSSVDGQAPAVLCQVFGAEEISAVLRVCAEAGAAVVPWGGGTLMSLGNIPKRVDAVLKLDKLARLVEHDDANLTATVEAGMTAAAFQGVLAERRQFLPVDPPRPNDATLGGLAAANINGPRRALYGGMRDLVIGMKMVLATGEQVKTGGKVVKNVAGYDLAKLFIGSLGTLGVITELTFRVSPLPEVAASFVATGALERCLDFAKMISNSALLPSALVIAGAADKDACRAIAWIEGFEEAVARHLRDLTDAAGRARIEAGVLRDGAHDSLWQELSGFGWGGDDLFCRLTVPIASIERVVSQIASQGAAGRRAQYAAYYGTGAIWVLLEPTTGGLERYRELAASARECRGHAIVASAPGGLKQKLDVWGEAPPTLALMRRIKQQFDPHGILSPGRFVQRL
ncbi:MAG TPA: FAD-binding oxidoreductase [Candidatus Binatia bacterium]|jgi:glycolate oxidase FAD binding subunit